MIISYFTINTELARESVSCLIRLQCTVNTEPSTDLDHNRYNAGESCTYTILSTSTARKEGLASNLGLHTMLSCYLQHYILNIAGLNR